MILYNMIFEINTFLTVCRLILTEGKFFQDSIQFNWSYLYRAKSQPHHLKALHTKYIYIEYL